MATMEDMKKKKNKLFEAKVVEIFFRIREVVEYFKQKGPTGLVISWIRDVQEWEEKVSNRELSKALFNFSLWKDKESFKEVIAAVENRYQDYLKSCSGGFIVFIAHNHNSPIAKEVEILLFKRDLTPVIMQEAPNEGVPIINKLKKTEFDLAIVVFTADPKFSKEANMNLAKLNVVMETGYCYGCLENISDVIILYDEKAKIPSNINGVEYIKLDENWKSNLLEALRIRGLI